MLLQLTLCFPDVRMKIRIITFIRSSSLLACVLRVFQRALQMTNVAYRNSAISNSTWLASIWKCQLRAGLKIKRTQNSQHSKKNKWLKKPKFTCLRHSIFEYFLPEGLEIGSLARSKSNARFISRILVRSRSHAVFLYSEKNHQKKLQIDWKKKPNEIFRYHRRLTIRINWWISFEIRWCLQRRCNVGIFQSSATVILWKFYYLRGNGNEQNVNEWLKLYFNMFAIFHTFRSIWIWNTSSIR